MTDPEAGTDAPVGSPDRTPREDMRIDDLVARNAVAGRITRVVSSGDPALHYRLYVPRHVRPNRPVLVAVHGISLNADEQVWAFASLADRHGLVLVAPSFDAERFADYQRLGRVGRGPRADLALAHALDELRSTLAIRSRRMLLFGYSGGGQFAHRYTMAHPKQVRAAVVAAAGWYTFPDTDARFPYGLRVGNALPGVRLRQRAFLRVPILVAVGDGDLERESSLRQSTRIDQLQGRNRVERAERWMQAMGEAAARCGLPSRVELSKIPTAGHSFAASFAAGLGELAVSFLRRPALRPNRSVDALPIRERPDKEST